MPTKAAPVPIKFDIVAFEDRDGLWIAQGIQYDIVARAKSVAGIREAFWRQLTANIVLNARFGRKGLEGIPPAPEKFKRMFDEADEQLRQLSQPARQEMDIRVVEAV